ncbi:MAG TPA: molecular chaperone TorD family protein [Planctomycetota bacterium]|nr:molecular chaperone TorD family protein [Planctomycetota bacterium]
MPPDSVRRALYVLFGRLLAGPPDADLYLRLRGGGLHALAEAQGIDLSSDLLDETDAVASASELAAEYARIRDLVPLRESDYAAEGDDPVIAISRFLAENRLQAPPDLPCDHLAVALGIMGELAGAADANGDDSSRERARDFFGRHLSRWALAALANLSEQAERRYYRGVAAMTGAFLESERRQYEAA